MRLSQKNAKLAIAVADENAAIWILLQRSILKRPVYPVQTLHLCIFGNGSFQTDIQ